MLSSSYCDVDSKTKSNKRGSSTSSIPRPPSSLHSNCGDDSENKGLYISDDDQDIVKVPRLILQRFEQLEHMNALLRERLADAEIRIIQLTSK
jgi:hypothetical protein